MVKQKSKLASVIAATLLLLGVLGFIAVVVILIRG